MTDATTPTTDRHSLRVGVFMVVVAVVQVLSPIRTLRLAAVGADVEG